MSVGVGARSARLLRCGTGFLGSTRHVRSFPVVKRPLYTRGVFKPTSSFWDDAPNHQKKLPATESPPNQVDNIEDFLALAQRGQATLSDANRFLWTKRRELEPLPLPESREKAARVGAGRILLWVWNNPDTFPLEEISGSFANVLVWFLHAEDLEEFIWDWIILEAQNMQSLGMIDRGGGGGGAGAGGSHHPLQWCHRLLRGLVEADFLWSVDGSSDAAVRRLLRAVDQFGPQSRYSNTVRLVAPGFGVEKMVKSSHDKHTCDVALFERLLLELQKWQPVHSQPVFERAHLMLYHPTHADATSWFDIVYDVYNGRDRCNQDRFSSTEGARKYWGEQILRAAHILRIKGDDHKAAYLELVLQKEFPRTWAKLNEIMDQFGEDVRLQRLTQKL
ncbi:hypothetical protein KC354_g15760 [Hortaea werneckii]|nr:hypothetical protein KC354_g15760 [Hortaea werneckii]